MQICKAGSLGVSAPGVQQGDTSVSMASLRASQTAAVDWGGACSATAAEPFQASDKIDKCPECIRLLGSQCQCRDPMATFACACLDDVKLIRDAVCSLCGGEAFLNLTAEGVLQIHTLCG